MIRQPRPRAHHRASKALTRFYMARTAVQKVARAEAVARYLGELLGENATLRCQAVTFGAEIDRQDAARKQLVALVDDWNRKAKG